MSLSKITNNPDLWTAKNDPTGTGPGAVRASSNPNGAAQLGFWSRLWSPLFANNKQDSSCYDRLNAKYPKMDSNSRSIVQILCDNNQTAIDMGGFMIQLSDQGIDAIGEALQENTALQSFTTDISCLSPDDDCIATLGNAFASALIVNRSLKELSIGFPYSLLGSETFLHNLPCYNLNSLTLQDASLDSGGAQDFSNSLQSNPYFPLKNLTWSWSMNGGDPFQEVMGGLGKTRCIESLNWLSSYFASAALTDLFQEAIGNSRIANVLLPVVDETPYPYIIPLTPAQEQAVLSGVASNACFLGYTQPNALQSFSPNLTVAIQNLLQGRTPCAPDSRCLLPVSCSTPTPPNPAPPDSGSALSNAAVTGIAVSVSVVGTLALGWLAKHAYQKCTRPSTPLSQQMM